MKTVLVMLVILIQMKIMMGYKMVDILTTVIYLLMPTN